MREASGEYGRCLEEKRLLVDEEVLIVDCGSLNLKGIQWKGAILMEEDGVTEEEMWTAIVHWLWIETGGSCNRVGSSEVNYL